MTQVQTEAAHPAPAAPRAAGALGGWPRFLLRRGLQMAVSVWLLVTFAFFLIRLVPGDPVRSALGFLASKESVQAKRHELGLDGSILTAYWHYLSALGHGDLGTSLISSQPVTQIIGARLPTTLTLAGLAFLAMIVIAVPLGLGMAVLTADGRRRLLELGFTSQAIFLAAIPEFFLAVVMVYVFAVKLTWLPAAGQSGPGSYLLPVVALALGPAVSMARIIRVEVLGVLADDYIRTARAKRLPGRLVYLRHALPNALTASLTVGGLYLGWLIAGTVLVETVFVWPGLGPTMVHSILDKDFTTIQGIVLVYGSLILVINLVVDLLLAVLDPRSMIREG